MKTVDILLLSNCTRARVPARRIFVGHDKTIAWVTIIVVLCVIATGIVATAVAGLKQGELALHGDAEAMVAGEKQVKQGGPLVGYKELW